MEESNEDAACKNIFIREDNEIDKELFTRKMIELINQKEVAKGCGILS